MSIMIGRLTVVMQTSYSRSDSAELAAQIASNSGSLVYNCAKKGRSVHRTHETEAGEAS